MTKKCRQVVGLVAIILGIIAFGVVSERFSSSEVRASAGQNISGWAWSENIGWISFNCTNQGCPDGDYGVNIDTVTGIFSGKAWSENIGKISFDEADLGGCPSGVCRAEMNLTNGEVSGWIRATSPIGDPEAGNWDGWIKLRGTESGTGAEYGVYYDTAGASPTLSGWAWGGDDNGSGSAVIGWIDFSDREFDPDDDDIINPPPAPVLPPGGSEPGDVIADYGADLPAGLVNVPPSATLDLVTPQAYCTSPKEAFSWNFNDTEDPLQTSYHLQVKKQTSPVWGFWTEGNGEYDSTKIDNTTENVLLSVTTGSTVGKLDYNTGYQWRLKVWDSGGLDSGWIDGVNFSTEDHMYPTVVINPTPIRASVDEWIMINDTSECYTIGGSSYDCYTEGGIISYQWDYSYKNPPGFQVDSTYKTSAGGTNASTTYATFGVYVIKLRIIDATISGAVCDSDGKTIYIGPRLPDWREIAP